RHRTFFKYGPLRIRYQGTPPRLVKFCLFARRLLTSTTPINLPRESNMPLHRLSRGERRTGLQLSRWVPPAHHPCSRQFRDTHECFNNLSKVSESLATRITQ